MDFLLEIVGLSLTVIEIFFPRKAEGLEKWLDDLPEKAPKLFYGNLMFGFNKLTGKYMKQQMSFDPKEEGMEADLQTPLGSFLFNLLGIVFLALTGGLLLGLAYLIFGESLFEDSPMMYPLGLIALGIILLSIGLIISVVAFIVVSSIKLIIGILNGMTNGRAIGATGLIIAIVGLISKLV